ncbi:hypothetical protein AKJ63_01675 [candidate division MSBL1 archaeon SCGC-AAA259D18]|uniref:Uncharacterized protein n=1 Tax=candidate division MSBL1 archaeon SCGC-AAA259D18 TaxID=1698262 RepID=A0A133UAT6_9EURY|nr:hypothetical protein AKJ63_01675 [candidate division MSBL1 archaeon SCGC-AAA259D18]
MRTFEFSYARVNPMGPRRYSRQNQVLGQEDGTLPISMAETPQIVGPVSNFFAWLETDDKGYPGNFISSPSKR